MTGWSRIAVVLIARNAADTLSEALRSIPPRAQVIVADGDSHDATANIARAHGAQVVAQDLDSVRRAGGNFDVARNAAGEHVSRDWILYLDADERLSPDLAEEIGRLSNDTPHAAFRFPRINLFWGRPVRLLGQDFVTRLTRKGRGRYLGSALHGQMQVDGSIGDLSGPLIHDNVRGWVDVVRRFRQYVPIEARAMRPAPDLWTVCAMPWRMFRFYYFTQHAWKDGFRGLIVSMIYAAYHSAIAWKARGRADD